MLMKKKKLNLSNVNFILCKGESLYTFYKIYLDVVRPKKRVDFYIKIVYNKYVIKRENKQKHKKVSQKKFKKI